MVLLSPIQLRIFYDSVGSIVHVSVPHAVDGRKWMFKETVFVSSLSCRQVKETAFRLSDRLTHSLLHDSG